MGLPTDCTYLRQSQGDDVPGSCFFTLEVCYDTGWGATTYPMGGDPLLQVVAVSL